MGFIPRNDWESGDIYPADRMSELEQTVADAESASSRAVKKDENGVVAGTPQFGADAFKIGGLGFEDGVQIGPDLLLSEVDGWAGQRLSLRGREDTHMPYFEVECCDPADGTDAGGAIGGYQIQRLGRKNGGGAGSNREFFAIESTQAGPFRIATWASGTGVVPALQLKAGNNYHLEMRPDGTMRTGSNIRFQFIAHNQETPIQVVANRQAYIRHQEYSDDANAPRLRFTKNRGTNTAPQTVKAGDPLGEVQFGTMTGESLTTEVSRATVRALAQQDFDNAGSGGAKLQFITTEKGTSNSRIDAEIDYPVEDGRTALLLAVRVGGVVTLQQVTVGEPDSAGVGFRALRVPN